MQKTKDSNFKKSINNDSSNEKEKLEQKTKKVATKTTKKSTTPKKTTTSKTAAKSTVSKTSSTKKVASKSTNSKVASKTSKKTTTSTRKSTSNRKKTNTSTKSKVDILEYYDLPYRYNQTVVKILAQTPTTLFVYWDISDDDRKNYIDNYGENFFENTVPVLIVHNKTMNYRFEIEINDFANSWYFNVNDAKCDYEIELGRKAKPQTEINLPNNYMYVTSSNVISAPNNHILFEKNQKVLFFRNVKTNTTVSKDVSQFQFMQYAGKIYNIYDVYKKIYKNEELENLENLSSSSF